LEQAYCQTTPELPACISYAGSEINQAESLVKNGAHCLLDFDSPEPRFHLSQKTIFVNAAWMTLEKTRVTERYQPVVLNLPIS